MNQDEKEVLQLTTGTFGCVCLAPALVLLGFLAGIAAIFRWAVS